MQGPIFLTLDHVLRLHSRQIDRFGGDSGIRDVDLIASAIAQPQAGGYGVYYHKDLAEMAAAYLFHLVSNHAQRIPRLPARGDYVPEATAEEQQA